MDEEYFSSDSEEPLTINMPAAEGMPLITSGARPSPPLAALQALLNLLSPIIVDRIASRLKHQALAAWVLEWGAWLLKVHPCAQMRVQHSTGRSACSATATRSSAAISLTRCAPARHLCNAYSMEVSMIKGVYD